MAYWPSHWKTEEIIHHGIAEILENERKIMAAIDDLNAAISKLQTDVATLLAGTTSTAQVEAAVSAVNAIDATVVAATTPTAAAHTT